MYSKLYHTLLKTCIFFTVILSILVLIQDRVSAQRKEDVLYLSNGSVIHGRIMDSTVHKVKILNHAGDIWAFDRSDVDSVKQSKFFEYRADVFNQPGFEFNINGEFLMRSKRDAVGKAVISGINMQFGYRIKPFISAGIETGIEFYEWTEVPFLACVKFRTSRRTLSPVLFARTGYTVSAEKRGDDGQFSYRSKGGPVTSAGIGIEKILNENASFLFTFSYHVQKLRYHLTPLNQWVQERDRTETYSRLRLTVGYVFK